MPVEDPEPHIGAVKFFVRLDLGHLTKPFEMRLFASRLSIVSHANFRIFKLVG
jgi:hypothetical protein